MFTKDTNAEEKIKKYLSDAKLSLAELNRITEGNYIIFGGACRDALAGELSCSDIDILTYQKYSFSNFTVIKRYVGNEYSNNLFGAKYAMLKNDISLDVLTPSNANTFYDFINFLTTVDINVSSIGYNDKLGFIEVIPNTIKYCKRKCFKVLQLAVGYSDIRTPKKIKKLLANDWLQIN